MSACWRSDFRIRKKSDVTEMFEGSVFSGEMYFTIGEYDFCFEKQTGKRGCLSWRGVDERGNIFNPYLCFVMMKRGCLYGPTEKKSISF